MTRVELERRSSGRLPSVRRLAVDEEALEVAQEIVSDVRRRGTEAVREHARRLGDIEPGEKLFVSREELEGAAEEVPAVERELLERACERIERFAQAQRDAIGDAEIGIPGGRAGHRVAPVEFAGCYAPGGRYPLPSSVLMTAATARVAGVDEVWVASPHPEPITLAAADVAGADGLLACGGAQAIAAMAYGIDRMPTCDVVVGPGNKWVTAAKKVVSGTVRIDMLAGPSELVVLADGTAEPETVAADLLAQAEHDVDALPIVVSTDEGLVAEVEAALADQLEDLPTAETARAALENGFAVVVDDIEEGVSVCDRLAPEHLEVLTEDAESVSSTLRHYGALFVGRGAAEVFGDYGAGPNHTLPTGGTARSTGGLSVNTFLRMRTWMRIDDTDEARELVRDTIDFARLESLEAHARSAGMRQDDNGRDDD